MKINLASAGHAAPVKNGDAEWHAYGTRQAKQLEMLKKALGHIKQKKGWRPCNKCFSDLPGGRSFDDILADDTVWISYCPSRTTFGFTDSVGGKEITVCQMAFNRGVWVVGGTIIHEMGHVNGADTSSHDAEGTLLCCGYSKVHDSTIIGVRDTVGQNIA